jgi:hypothetical protein
MNDNDLLLARAQVGLAFLMALGFLSTLFVLIAVHNELAPVENSLLSGLTGVLGTIVTQQSGYFFARQRPHALADDTDDSPAPLAQPSPEKPK